MLAQQLHEVWYDSLAICLLIAVGIMVTVGSAGYAFVAWRERVHARRHPEAQATFRHYEPKRGRR